MTDKDVDWHFGQTMDIPLGERIAIRDARKAKNGKKKFESDARRSSMKSTPEMARRWRSSFQLHPGASGSFQDGCSEAEKWGHFGVEMRHYQPQKAQNGPKTAKIGDFLLLVS
jgi:hypothetical protein